MMLLLFIGHSPNELSRKEKLYAGAKLAGATAILIAITQLPLPMGAGLVLPE
jgi:hypothetical protein